VGSDYDDIRDTNRSNELGHHTTNMVYVGLGVSDRTRIDTRRLGRRVLADRNYHDHVTAYDNNLHDVASYHNDVASHLASGVTTTHDSSSHDDNYDGR